MNPFEIPFSGGAGWVEIALALGASVVFLIYLYQVLFPRIQSMIGLKPDPEARAAALLDQYKRQRASEEKL